MVLGASIFKHIGAKADLPYIIYNFNLNGRHKALYWGKKKKKGLMRLCLRLYVWHKNETQHTHTHKTKVASAPSKESD